MVHVAPGRLGFTVSRCWRSQCACHVSQDDLRKVYEGLMRDVNIRVIELQDHVLSMYDRQISNYTQKEFQR